MAQDTGPMPDHVLSIMGAAPILILKVLISIPCVTALFSIPSFCILSQRILIAFLVPKP